MLFAAILLLPGCVNMVIVRATEDIALNFIKRPADATERYRDYAIYDGRRKGGGHTAFI